MITIGNQAIPGLKLFSNHRSSLVTSRRQAIHQLAPLAQAARQKATHLQRPSESLELGVLVLTK